MKALLHSEIYNPYRKKIKRRK